MVMRAVAIWTPDGAVALRLRQPQVEHPLEALVLFAGVFGHAAHPEPAPLVVWMLGDVGVQKVAGARLVIPGKRFDCRIQPVDIHLSTLTFLCGFPQILYLCRVGAS